MLSRKDFIVYSLEMNLIFQRLIKEHLFFIETSLAPVNKGEICEAKVLKKSFEELLSETVIFSNCAISEDALESNTIVTPYTLSAEEITSRLTGGEINTNITKAELGLESDPDFNYTPWLEEKVSNINDRTLNLLDEVINFKKELYDLMVNCKKFACLYPSLVEHTSYEAELYRDNLNCLQDRMLPKRTICDTLDFWNEIMRDHASFIDGLLDPTEIELKEIAHEYVEEFNKILAKNCNESNEKEIFYESLKCTKSLMEFKETATKKLIECEIKSILSPLIADHVLREANYYLKILNEIEE